MVVRSLGLFMKTNKICIFLTNCCLSLAPIILHFFISYNHIMGNKLHFSWDVRNIFYSQVAVGLTPPLHLPLLPSEETFSYSGNVPWLLWAHVGAPAGRANGGTEGKWGKLDGEWAEFGGRRLEVEGVMLLVQGCLSILWLSLSFASSVNVLFLILCTSY